jgi:hypothetical protein
MITKNPVTMLSNSIQMQDAILQNISNPEQLEYLYRKNKADFRKTFNSIYPQLKDNLAAQIWNQRLNQEQQAFFYGDKSDLRFVFVAALISGMVANIPKMIGIEMDVFLQKNIGFVVFPMLIVFFAIKQRLTFKQLALPLFAILVSALYINLLPKSTSSDSFDLAVLHLPVFLWSMLGYAYVGANLNNPARKIEFLRFNGDVVVMTAIIVLSGILFTAITIGLYGIIGMDIEQFYTEHVLIWGLSAIPIVSTFLVYTNPQLVNKISPTIAGIFTPIVFTSLLVFLGVMAFTGKNFYQDRDSLMILNALLIAVMAIVVFSLTEATRQARRQINYLILFGLSLLTIVLNGIALSAIVFRLAEFGITPNRIAVLGANLLIFINLVMVSKQLFLFLRGKSPVEKIEHVIALFLPAYAVWTAFVTFVLPLLFGFK